MKLERKQKFLEKNEIGKKTEIFRKK